MDHSSRLLFKRSTGLDLGGIVERHIEVVQLEKPKVRFGVRLKFSGRPALNSCPSTLTVRVRLPPTESSAKHLRAQSILEARVRDEDQGEVFQIANSPLEVRFAAPLATVAVPEELSKPVHRPELEGLFEYKLREGVVCKLLVFTVVPEVGEHTV